MRASFRSSTVSRLVGAVAGLWLCGTGAAWAGGGGADLASLNIALGDLCTLLENTYSVTLPFCPQTPTTTQGTLQLAAWNVVPPEMIRATNSIPLGSAVDAGNPSIAPPGFGPIPPPITTFPVVGTVLSNLLPNLKPLAFMSSATQGTAAAATQLYNTDADAFLYAVASGFSDHGGQPDTLFLFYDDTSRTNGNLMQGKIVATISLPLVVLSSDGITERLVPTTLQFRVPSASGLPCSASTVVGNFSGASSGTQTLMAAQIGVNCAVVFAPSPISTKSHAIFEVAVPLLVTMATDPLYIPGNPIANVGGPFTGDIPGFPAGSSILGSSGSIGIGPAAAPLCSTSGTCPPPTYALCANLPVGNGNGQAPVPAVAAYYAMSTAGETLLSAALPSFTTSVCPF
jgi:hypothetical protein